MTARLENGSVHFVRNSRGGLLTGRVLDAARARAVAELALQLTDLDEIRAVDGWAINYGFWMAANVQADTQRRRARGAPGRRERTNERTRRRTHREKHFEDAKAIIQRRPRLPDSDVARKTVEQLQCDCKVDTLRRGIVRQARAEVGKLTRQPD